MNTIEKLVKRKETKSFQFKPNSKFYHEVGINQKRWGLIFRNEIAPTITELKAIANYFEVELIDLI